MWRPRKPLAFACLLAQLTFVPQLMGQALPAAGSVPDSPEGFAGQYQPLFSAWSKNRKEELQARLEQFAIPGTWFLETFGDGEGRRLARLYAVEFEDFKRHIARNFDWAATSAQKMALARFSGEHAELVIATKQEIRADPMVVPQPPPPPRRALPNVQKFSSHAVVFAGNAQKSVGSWMDNFLYIDGRFRFLGRGAYPFWDQPGVRRADPCANPGESPGGALISRVEPQYPDAAREKHISGAIRARLTIAPDGRVADVEYFSGPPDLWEAARQAFAQWVYTPFTNCGHAVEMRSFEELKFVAP